MIRVNLAVPWVAFMLGFASLSTPTRASAHDTAAHFLRPGLTVVSGTSAHGRVITARCMTGTTSKALGRLKGFWGVESGSPAVAVTGLSITAGKDTVDIPFTAWADLGYPESLWLSFGAEADTLSLRGGSTSTGYTARWIIKGERLTKRRVEWGEFPDDIWQETLYSAGPPAEERD